MISLERELLQPPTAQVSCFRTCGLRFPHYKLPQEAARSPPQVKYAFSLRPTLILSKRAVEVNLTPRAQIRKTEGPEAPRAKKRNCSAQQLSPRSALSSNSARRLECCPRCCCFCCCTSKNATPTSQPPTKTPALYLLLLDATPIMTECYFFSAQALDRCLSGRSGSSCLPVWIAGWLAGWLVLGLRSPTAAGSQRPSPFHQSPIPSSSSKNLPHLPLVQFLRHLKKNLTGRNSYSPNCAVAGGILSSGPTRPRS